MSVVPPVARIGADRLIGALRAPVEVGPAAAHAPATTSFMELLSRGVDAVETKVSQADAMAQSFALDDSIPVHQVTYALEQAHLSLAMMMQVRSRLLEAYQQLMALQL
jgi:flagellar hook-basal body complex protein FliE